MEVERERERKVAEGEIGRKHNNKGCRGPPRIHRKVSSRRLCKTCYKPVVARINGCKGRKDGSIGSRREGYERSGGR